MLAAREDVSQKRLVQPRRAQRSGAVVDCSLEDLEARAARAAQAAREHPARDRRGLPRFQRRNRLEVAAILVAKRKAVEKIVDGDEAGVLQIRRAPGTDAFEELQRRRQHLVGGHCTIMA